MLWPMLQAGLVTPEGSVSSECAGAVASLMLEKATVVAAGCVAMCVVLFEVLAVLLLLELARLPLLCRYALRNESAHMSSSATVRMVRYCTGC